MTSRGKLRLGTRGSELALTSAGPAGEGDA